MTIKNFVIFATDHLGDNLVLYELIYNIRNIYKTVNISLVVHPNGKIIGDMLDGIDRVVTWDKSIKGLKGALELKKQIGYKQVFATIITFTRQRPIFTAQILNSKYILFHDINFIFNTFLRRCKYKINNNKEIPISTNVANLLQGISKEKIVHVPVKLNIENLANMGIDTNYSNYIAINPIGIGDYKCLTVEQLADIISFFNNQNVPVLILGKGDKAFEYSNSLKILNLNFIDLINKTRIEELIWIIKSVKGLISVDTGTAHLATYLNIKTLWLAKDSQWIPDYLYKNAKRLSLNSKPADIYQEVIKLCEN